MQELVFGIVSCFGAVAGRNQLCLDIIERITFFFKMSYCFGEVFGERAGMCIVI